MGIFSSKPSYTESYKTPTQPSKQRETINTINTATSNAYWTQTQSTYKHTQQSNFNNQNNNMNRSYKVHYSPNQISSQTPKTSKPISKPPMQRRRYFGNVNESTNKEKDYNDSNDDYEEDKEEDDESNDDDVHNQNSKHYYHQFVYQHNKTNQDDQYSHKNKYEYQHYDDNDDEESEDDEDELPEMKCSDFENESPRGKLYKILNDILLDIIPTHYVPDFVLRNKIEEKLKYHNLVPQYQNKIITLTKYQNGAWELKILVGSLRNVSTYFGLQIEIDNELNENIREIIFKRLKSCPKLVRESRNLKQKNNLTVNNNIEFGICNICFQIARPTLKFGRHICRVKSTYRCSNCNQSWASHIALLDPNTEKPPLGVKSYCKRCNSYGIFIKYKLNDRDNQNNTNQGRHLSKLCSVCRKWGDCRGLFIQMDTLKKAFELMNQELQFIKYKDEETGEVCYGAQYMEANMEATFYIIPYINIV